MVDLLDLLANYGFPVATCAYLLYDRTVLMKDFQKSIENNTAATNALIDLIKK